MRTGIRTGLAGVLVIAVTATPALAASDRTLAGFDGLAAAGYTGAGVVVAVVDTGIDLDHPALTGRVVPGWDFVDGDDVPRDGNGHGTHVSGIVAASLTSETPGGAPEASIMPVRVLADDGTGSSENVAAGIRWAADHGASVINLSVGDSGPADRFRKGGPIALALRAVAGRAVVVVAAGNDAQYEELFRAGVPGVVVVAVDSAGNPASFTNVGDTRAVAAPGVDIRSTAPSYATALFPSGTNGYATLSGTSMAAPLVSAEAALLVAAGLSPASVRDIIPATADNPSGDARLGAGIIDAAAALGAATSQTTEAVVAPGASPTTPSDAVAPSDAAATPSDNVTVGPGDDVTVGPGDDVTVQPSDSASETSDVAAVIRPRARGIRWGAVGVAVLVLVGVGTAIAVTLRRRK